MNRFRDLPLKRKLAAIIMASTGIGGPITPTILSFYGLTEEKMKSLGGELRTETDPEHRQNLDVIIGFGSRPEPGARLVAESEGVDIRYYEVIYNLVEDVEKALKGLLEPVYKDVVEGEAEIRQVFRIRRRGTIAGCYVKDGVVKRGALTKVLRADEELADTRIDSLRRFQEDVREVQSGYECGIALEGFNDFQEGDVFRFYRRERES